MIIKIKSRYFLELICFLSNIIFIFILSLNIFNIFSQGFLDSSAGKESACNVGDLGSIPGLGRSPWEGNGYPLQYSGLENSMDCVIQGITKSQMWLSNFRFHWEEQLVFVILALHWYRLWNFTNGPSYVIPLASEVCTIVSSFTNKEADT